MFRKAEMRDWAVSAPGTDAGGARTRALRGSFVRFPLVLDRCTWANLARSRKEDEKRRLYAASRRNILKPWRNNTHGHRVRKERREVLAIFREFMCYSWRRKVVIVVDIKL